MNPPLLIFPFYQEDHIRRGRAVLRPVARFSIGAAQPVVSALIDTGSEHVLADSTLALIAGVNLDDPVDVEELGIGGGFVRARFVEVTGILHPPDGQQAEPVSWTLDVGFIDDWRPLYPVLLGNVGFLDRFTVTVSRFAQATVVEPLDTFDIRFGAPPGHHDPG
jgi:hypothetical protein